MHYNFGSLAAASILLALLPGSAFGLVIYRWGGETLSPPSQSGSEGVDFVQLAWTDVAEEGQVFQLDMDESIIRPLSFGPEDNIAPLALEKGGVFRHEDYHTVFDGDLNTVFVSEEYQCSEKRGGVSCDGDYGSKGTIQIHLKGFFALDRIRIASGVDDPVHTARNIRVHVTDNPPDLPFWLPGPFRPVIVEVRDNREQFLDVDISSHGKVAFVQVALSQHTVTWDVHDIEIYARGFVDKSTYISNIVDFGRPMAWGELRWGGRRDPNAQVFIQTRSGLDDDPTSFFRFTGRGGEKVEVERDEYNKLKLGQKAGTGIDQTNWTFWSAPYDFADSAGTAVVSLSPRQYLQFKVDFLSNGEAGGAVRFLELRASEPVASELVGEVWPLEAKVGEQTLFTYALRPTIRSDDAGFDRLELTTASLLGKVEQVRIGDVVVEHRVEVQEPHRLEVSFPPLQAPDSGALIEVMFTAQVMRYGTQFEGRVRNSAQPLEVPQRVHAGDATDAFEGNRVVVATSVREQSLLQVAVEPAVFTPNGDGVNDVASIVYDVFEITGQASISVEIRDLSGRLVRQVYGGEAGIGHYLRQWDGRDEAGELAPPGIYLYRISLDGDERDVGATGILQMVY